MVTTIGDIRYLEALQLPRLEQSLECLLSKYCGLMTEYHISSRPGALELIEKSLEEGNGVMVLHDFLGYCILVWKDKTAGTD